jgi:hypothetical protein
METTKVYAMTWQLGDTYGEKVLEEVAQKATRLEAQGNITAAQTGRCIEAALKEMRGPRAS